MIVYLIYLKMNIIEEKHKTVCEAKPQSEVMLYI